MSSELPESSGGIEEELVEKDDAANEPVGEAPSASPGAFNASVGKKDVADEPVGEWDKPGAGCRPCCSAPHGMRGVLAAICALIAWIFSIMTLNSCDFMAVNFLYCHPAPPPAPAYGTCGDCHCIAGDSPCPTNPAEIPPTEFSQDLIDQLKFQQPTNPFRMLCNPYNHTGTCGFGHCGECTDPPQDQDQIELWETAVCGLKYNMSSLTDDYCPTQYEMITYDSFDEMFADGAQQTHWGACGPCSTSQDLTVYMENPDLTGKGQECGIRGLLDTQDGINCFMEAGYTAECSEAWMYNVFNTRDKCFDVCIDFTFFGPGINAGPPPECRIANCLLCDEQMSGPIFQEVAARSRRRSGLLSKIARPCNVILIVNHTNPCGFVREQLNVGRSLAEVDQVGASHRTSRAPLPNIYSNLTGPNPIKPIPPPAMWTPPAVVDEVGPSYWTSMSPPPRFSRRTSTYSNLTGPNPDKPLPPPEKWTPPVYEEECFYMKEVIGLMSYEGAESNNWLFGDDPFFLSPDQQLLTSQYSTCFRYEFRNVLEGFWYNMIEIFGPIYKAAKAFGIIAVALGGLTLIFVWTTTCIAYPARFWTIVFGIFSFCGLCAFLTLLFLGSDVCNGPDGRGCAFGKGAASAIVAGIFWWVAAYFAFTTGPYKLEQQTAACCCCPTTVSGTGASPAAYSPVPTEEPARTEVSVVETVKSDGTVVVEKTTTYPNGAKAVEITTTKTAKEED